MITMKLTGKKELLEKIQRMPKGTAAHVSKATLSGAEDLANKARLYVPRKSGNLARSIKFEQGRNGLGARVVVGAFYSRFVEKGTQAHRLGKGQYVRNGRQRGNYFRRGRRHPGSRPAPFLSVAYKLTKARIRSRISRAIRKAVKEFEGS